MKITVYDHGLNTEVAVALGKAGHTVAYYSPWDEAYPKSARSIIGSGLDHIERIPANDASTGFWQAADRSDLICFFDTFNADQVAYLRKQGKLVWGAGPAERIEADRAFMREYLKNMGASVAPYKAIKGVQNLINYLKPLKDKWVKLSQFRGDIETWHHDEWDSSSAQFFGQMLVDFGANEGNLEFIVEDPIKGAEVGYDGFVVDGEFANLAIVGYEAKDEAYVGKFDIIPHKLTSINHLLAGYFAENEAKTFFSTEIRMTANADYLTDPCVRCPHPPTAAMLVQIGNIADIITEGARGKLITLKPTARYSAAVVIESGWAADHWTEIKFPSKIRNNVKLQRAFCDEGHYYAVPGAEVVATCVGTGGTLDKAIEAASDIAKQVSCRGMSFNLAAFDHLRNETIPAGEKMGIKF